METVQQSLSHLLGLNILSASSENMELNYKPNKNVFEKQQSTLKYFKNKPILIKNNKINETEITDKIIIDANSYPCPCSDCGGFNSTADCLLDARIIELQNKFNNVKTYFDKINNQYIITIPKQIKILKKGDNQSCVKHLKRRNKKVNFKIGET